MIVVDLIRRAFNAEKYTEETIICVRLLGRFENLLSKIVRLNMLFYYLPLRGLISYWIRRVFYNKKEDQN